MQAAGCGRGHSWKQAPVTDRCHLTVRLYLPAAGYRAPAAAAANGGGRMQCGSPRRIYKMAVASSQPVPLASRPGAALGWCSQLVTRPRLHSHRSCPLAIGARLTAASVWRAGQHNSGSDCSVFTVYRPPPRPARTGAISAVGENG